MPVCTPFGALAGICARRYESLSTLLRYLCCIAASVLNITDESLIAHKQVLLIFVLLYSVAAAARAGTLHVPFSIQTGHCCSVSLRVNITWRFVLVWALAFAVV